MPSSGKGGGSGNDHGAPADRSERVPGIRRAEVVSGVFWSLVGRFSGQLISVLTLLVLARFLEPEAFGLIALATVFTGFIEMLVLQGLSSAVVQRESLDHAHLNTAFWLTLGMGTTLMFVALGAAGAVAELFGDPRLGPIIRWLSLSFLFVGLCSVQRAVLRREMRFKVLEVRSLTASLAGNIVAVSLAVQGWGVWSLVIRHLVRWIVEALVLWRSCEWRPRWEISRSHYRSLLGFSANVMGIRLVTLVGKRLDRLIIGYFLGPAVLGYYYLALQAISRMEELPRSMVAAVGLPVFSRLRHEGERLSRAFSKALEFAILLVVPVSVMAIFAAPEAVEVAFGARWLALAPIMQTLAIGSVGAVVLVLATQLIVGLGFPQQVLLLRFTSLVVGAGAMLGAVRYSVTAVAMTAALISLLTAVAALFVAHRLMVLRAGRTPRLIRSGLLAGVAMGATMTVVAGALDHVDVVLRLAALIVSGLFAYAASLRFVEPALLREIRETAVSFRSVADQRGTRTTEP